MSALTDTDTDALRAAAGAATSLEVLFLFGSRGRGDAHAHSDWDFGYLAGPGFDVEGLLTTLVLAVGSDRVDLVDLARASGLLRYRVARDGVVILERTSGAADRFRVEAIQFWCDAGPAIEREYAHILDAGKA